MNKLILVTLTALTFAFITAAYATEDDSDIGAASCDTPKCPACCAKIAFQRAQNMRAKQDINQEADSLFGKSPIDGSPAPGTGK
jgi:hypothetical protein